MRKWLSSYAVLPVLLLGWPSYPAGAQPAPTEYEVKAAYLLNMAHYVEWPHAPGAEDEPTLSVCVYGDDPFGPALDAIHGKAAGGRTVHVRRVHALSQTVTCRVLFISRSERPEIERIVHSVGTKGVLTVGDSPGAAERGVIVNFYLERERVRFEINTQAAVRAGLTISSRLLQLARIVKEP